MSLEQAAWAYMGFLAACAAYSYVACSVREKESAREYVEGQREPSNQNESTRGIA